MPGRGTGARRGARTRPRRDPSSAGAPAPPARPGARPPRRPPQLRRLRQRRPTVPMDVRRRRPWLERGCAWWGFDFRRSGSVTSPYQGLSRSGQPGSTQRHGLKFS